MKGEVVRVEGSKVLVRWQDGLETWHEEKELEKPKPEEMD